MDRIPSLNPNYRSLHSAIIAMKNPTQNSLLQPSISCFSLIPSIQKQFVSSRNCPYLVDSKREALKEHSFRLHHRIFQSTSLQIASVDVPISSITPLSLTFQAEDVFVTIQNQPAETFSPVTPPLETLVGLASVLVISAISSYVWSTYVVPISRAKLAISKKSGPLAEYLDDLIELDVVVASSDVNETDSNEMLDGELFSPENFTSGNNQESSLINKPINSSQKDERKFEKWLFTDWIQQKSKKRRGIPSVKKEPALPVLKDAKWNSGDNPVLVTFSILMVGVIGVSIVERVIK